MRTKGSPETEAVEQGQQRASASASLLVGKGLDRSKGRSEARCPTDAEHHAEHRRPAETGARLFFFEHPTEDRFAPQYLTDELARHGLRLLKEPTVWWFGDFVLGAAVRDG